MKQLETGGRGYSNQKTIMEQTTEQKNEAESLVKKHFPSLSCREEDPYKSVQDEREKRDKQILSKKLLDDCGLPKRHSHPFTPEGEEWITAETRLKAKIGSGFIIALCGSRGTGKTQLAASLDFF